MSLGGSTGGPGAEQTDLRMTTGATLLSGRPRLSMGCGGEIQMLRAPGPGSEVSSADSRRSPPVPGTDGLTDRRRGEGPMAPSLSSWPQMSSPTSPFPSFHPTNRPSPAPTPPYRWVLGVRAAPLWGQSGVWEGPGQPGQEAVGVVWGPPGSGERRCRGTRGECPAAVEKGRESG